MNIKQDYLKTGFKLVASTVDNENVAKLSELIDNKANDGWKLVTCINTAGELDTKGAIIVTFRRKK